jgi:hypothetical protein
MGFLGCVGISKVRFWGAEAAEILNFNLLNQIPGCFTSMNCSTHTQTGTIAGLQIDSESEAGLASDSGVNRDEILVCRRPAPSDAASQHTADK